MKGKMYRLTGTGMFGSKAPPGRFNPGKAPPPAPRPAKAPKPSGKRKGK